jgi:hypothetical protein
MGLRTLFLICSLLFISEVRGEQTEVDGTRTSYSPKISFRIPALTLTVNQASGRGGFTFGGLNLSFHYFVSKIFSMGLGYRADLDFAAKNMPISGGFAAFRLYFLGNGTRIVSSQSDINSEIHDRWNLYGGLELGAFSYFDSSVRSDEQNDIIRTGTFFASSAAVGTDIRITRNVEFNLEGNFGNLSFAASNTNFRLTGFQILFGLNYLW